jgi:hypothetical protein
MVAMLVNRTGQNEQDWPINYFFSQKPFGQIN